MSLLAVHDFELALTAPCLAMTERGIRVDEDRRRAMLADLKAWRDPLVEEARAIVLPLLQAAKKLPKEALFHEVWTCPCCKNGSAKRAACWSCAGFERKPTKKMLRAKIALCMGIPYDEVTNVAAFAGAPCTVCAGNGQRTTWAFKPSSPEQLKIVLYSVLKLPKRFKDKKLTTNEAALKGLRAYDTTGLVAKLLQIGKAATISEILVRIAPHNYHCPQREFSGPCVCNSDLRIRTFANVAGTETGRFSFSGGQPDNPNPKQWALVPSTNLGNMPNKVAKEDPRFEVRACFIPREGYALIEADLSGAEAWVVAALCGDHDLLARLRDGLDVHRWTAGHLFGKVDVDVTGFERFCGKETRHSGNYKRGPKTLMERINFYSDQTGFSITLAQARAFDEKYRALHPLLPDWWAHCARALRDNPVLTTIFERSRTFFGRGRYDENSETVREWIANEPQSTVADLLNRGLLRWWERYDGKIADLLLQVYDSVLLEAPSARAALAGQHLKRCLTEEIIVNDIPLVIPVDVSTSTTSWAEMEAA